MTTDILYDRVQAETRESQKGKRDVVGVKSLTRVKRRIASLTGYDEKQDREGAMSGGRGALVDESAVSHAYSRDKSEDLLALRRGRGVRDAA